MKNRRSSPRHLATEFRVWLGQWVSPDRFEAQAARIENISLGGARIVTKTPLTKSQSVWLRMGTPACVECVEALILDVQELADGEYSARLEFDTPCPRHLLMIATAASIPSPHFRRQHVRDASGDIVDARKLTRWS